MIEPVGKVAEIVGLLGGGGRLLILTHNNPDPDSIAAAFGLRHILSYVTKIGVKLGYGGTIGRAENRAMVKLLRIPLHPMTGGMASRFKHIAVVDAQPGAKNVSLTQAVDCDIVIDHHMPLKGMKSKFTDLREHFGSTSTIISEYIKENEIPLSARVATALYYGIKTDTDDLGRGSTDYDFKMIQFLFPNVSLKLLQRIENASIPRDYVRHYSEGVSNAVIYRDVVVSDLGSLTAPEAAAELADFLLKIEGMKWSLCFGRIDMRIYFSIRTRRKSAFAGKLAVRMAGKKGSAGGHDCSAGGFVLLEGVSEPDFQIQRKKLADKFLKMLARDKTNFTPLIDKD